MSSEPFSLPGNRTKATDQSAAASQATPGLPSIICQGKCVASCGPLPVTPTGLARMSKAIGKPLTVDNNMVCSALDQGTGRCRGYEKRPLICRLWGVAEGMECAHGCSTTGELSYLEAVNLMAFNELTGGTMVTTLPVTDSGHHMQYRDVIRSLGKNGA